jgi:hypothetical protein
MAFLGSPFNLIHGHNTVTGHTMPIRVKKRCLVEEALSFLNI